MRNSSRREFINGAAGVLLAGAATARGPHGARAAGVGSNASLKLRYVLPTNQYGTLPIADIVPEVHAAGCGGLASRR